eukprot:14253673-Heterocapsa_arctica.AAC.1
MGWISQTYNEFCRTSAPNFLVVENINRELGCSVTNVTPPRTRAKSIGHYVLMKTIGEGTFGKVKL